MIAVAVLAAALGGCTSSGPEGDVAENLAPVVWLSSAPPEGTTEKYTIHLYWGGWDPDGLISHFEYSVTNNAGGLFQPADTTGPDKWHRVYANDSTFSFSADSLVETNPTTQRAEFQRSHTFFIRAVDERGKASIEPAHRSFTARTLSPTVSIQVPVRNNLNAAIVPPITTFRWKAVDYIFNEVSTQPPDSVQWALLSTSLFDSRTGRSQWQEATDFLRKAPYIFEPSPKAYGGIYSRRDSDDAWQPWIFYNAPGDTGKFWTTGVVDFGDYIFAMRAKDEAGAITPVLDEITNVRRVTVTRRSTGPSLTVYNIYVGAANSGRCSTPPTIVDIPAGVPLDFTFNATAVAYGGTVAAFRYGWDIDDTEDPEQWEVDYSPYLGATTVPTRTFYFGTHTFCVEVLDNSGLCSRLCLKVNIVPFTMERPLLLIDDFLTDRNTTAGWNNSLGRGYAPTDDEHDSFWSYVLSDVDGFDADVFEGVEPGGVLGTTRVRNGEDVLEVVPGADVSLVKLANYRSIIWSVSASVGANALNQPLLYEFVRHRERYPRENSLLSSGKVRPNLLALFLAAGGHLFICGENPVSTTIDRELINGSFRIPLMLLYELEGRQDRAPDTAHPIGDRSFCYRELCIDVLDYARMSFERRRRRFFETCEIFDYRTATVDSENRRTHTMREAIPIDPVFPRLVMHTKCTRPGRYFQESSIGHDCEIYNPQYFFDLCQFVQGGRACFEPIYGLHCLDSSELTYGQPIAFWTSAYADRVSEAEGAIGARSVVWGFSPVYFEETAAKEAIDQIVFGEWQLERKREE